MLQTFLLVFCTRVGWMLAVASGQDKLSHESAAATGKSATSEDPKKKYTNVSMSGTTSNEEGDAASKMRSTTNNASGATLIQITCDELGRIRRPIEDEPYYHGFMTRQECEQLLNKHGHFLVRKTQYLGTTSFALSTFHDQKHHHFLVKRTQRKRLFWLYKYAFISTGDLIQYHYRNRESICAEGLKLYKPCFKQEWQLNHEQVEKNGKLGEGAFGEVYKGWLQTSPFLPRTPVAIKTLHSTTSSTMDGDERIKFLKEANLMLTLKHDNVVKLYGVCTAREPIQIVMELAASGSLLSKLENRETPPTQDDKVNFVFGAAKGMGYLEMKSIIHRDLAARNCLLGENNTVKISDFGLSMLGNEFREKKLKNVPTRWLAPETLKRGRYSSKSDVYSFSVLMWEIYANGKLPHEGLADKDIKKMVLEHKAKLTIPVGEIPEYMEQLRTQCADFAPEKRPTFEMVVATVSEMPGVIHPPPPSHWSQIKERIHNWMMS